MVAQSFQFSSREVTGSGTFKFSAVGILGGRTRKGGSTYITRWLALYTGSRLFPVTSFDPHLNSHDRTCTLQFGVARQGDSTLPLTDGS